MSESKNSCEVGSNISGCDSSAQLLPKRTRNQSSCCVTDISIVQYEIIAKDLYTSKVKLKIYFYLLLVVNIVLLGVVGALVYINFIRYSNVNDVHVKNLSLSKDSGVTFDDGKTERLSATRLSAINTGGIKCATLKYKLNAVDVNPDGTCSFEELIDALIRFVKPREFRDAIHLVGGKPMNKKNEHYEFTIEWNRDRLEKSLVKYHVTNSSIIIPSDGYYFLYCRLTFSSNAMQPLPRQASIKHSIRIKPINEHFQRLVTVSTLPSDSQSYIQRVVKLRKDEQLKVTISQAGKQHYDGSDVSSNYFGMFKL
uniref:Uncharacterized protein LOC111135427 n=1 Tax=Crassostrea virginica TaxID=6565 RepID=A0A8B8EMU3_CRAVI|nr:uncharacterized protein LOC111135427 [Crassostrea virginica]